MATSLSNPKFSRHSRSISLPSSSHPLLVSAEEQLQRLKPSESTSSSSHAIACQNLDGLKNLYESQDDVLQLPLSRQVLSHERFDKWEEEILDGSLRLLDKCSAVRDIYSQRKEIVQELESSLRRQRGGKLDNEVSTYTTSKKHLNKLIAKYYKEMKNCTLAVVNKDSKAVPLVNLINEVQEVSLTVMKSTLSFVSSSKIGSQQRSRSLVSRLFQLKIASCEGVSDIAAIEKIENDLHLLNNKKSNKDGHLLLQIQNLVKDLEALDSSIQELAEVLETVFRLLLKTRVSLLNILNH